MQVCGLFNIWPSPGSAWTILFTLAAVTFGLVLAFRIMQPQYAKQWIWSDPAQQLGVIFSDRRLWIPQLWSVVLMVCSWISMFASPRIVSYCAAGQA
jgi:hypothetical protein